MSRPALPPQAHIRGEALTALREDLGAKPHGLERWVPAGRGKARIICRQAAVLCGVAWCEQVFRSLPGKATCRWRLKDGDAVKANTCVAEITAPQRSLLLGERTALNFLQLLSGVATTTRGYVKAVGRRALITDTRKTIPGLRMSQKYAVRCGGGHNHRMGLHDATLIKENHIAACGGLEQAYALASKSGTKPMVEVENIRQARSALALGADFLLLDNFSLRQLRRAVEINQGKATLEASGGITLRNARAVAATGVDRMAIGPLTRDLKSVDFSMLHCR